MALEQFLDVAPRFRDSLQLIRSDDRTGKFLVRVSRTTDGTAAWHDTYEPCIAPRTTFNIRIPADIADLMRDRTHSDLVVELDVFPGDMLLGEEGERPQQPFIIVAVEGKTAFMRGIEMLTVDTEIEELWAQVPATFFKMIAKSDRKPGRVAVRKQWLAAVLEGPCTDFGIKLALTPNLPAIQLARRSLEQYSSEHLR